MTAITAYPAPPAPLIYTSPFPKEGVDASVAVHTEAIVAQLERTLKKALVAERFNHAVVANAHAGGEFPASGISPWLAFHRSAVAQEQMKAELGQLAIQLHAAPDERAAAARAPGDSHNDFFQGISDAMGRLQEGWVDPNQQALQNYLEFFQEFSRIMAALKDAISAGEDGKVVVSFGALRANLEAMLHRYGPSAMGVFASQAAAANFLRDAGLNPSEFPITDLGNGQFGIGMPENVVWDVINSMQLPSGNSPLEWDTARYNAWLSGKDSHVEKLQHFSQVLAERFSRVNDILNNLIKVLSATIDSITEADKAFIHAL
ncbi:IpaD/SipD/SspD family type III secretion system needle tip protein [Pseudoxanthomonas sp. UTMC 1351]|uniref:IpaD/SipD/SspD family type III secretion system needle tip protein n=1 Tax=Pseudoxanthomonas sp. UTMC 1351 TaxID=2695853 RepID=UPI0034CF77DF